ncbi:MAG: GAF domain-containing protein [Gemmatimonadota bacterium]|nr:MAG: GAF domain-containing protein [Gemmatimonadota bacterium]
MLDGVRIADELWEMAEEEPDAIFHRAVQRIRQHGHPYDWVGIYLLSGKQLILHSYIGLPTDAVRIPVGRGTCGTAAAEDRDMSVPDVEAAPNGIACSPEARSEVVVLVRHGGRVLGLINIGSGEPAAFHEDDERELRRVADVLGEVVGPRLQ